MRIPITNCCAHTDNIKQLQHPLLAFRRTADPVYVERLTNTLRNSSARTQRSIWILKNDLHTPALRKHLPTIEATERSMECRDGLYVVTLVAADGTTKEVAFSVDDADREKAPDAQRLMLRRSTERAPDGKTRWEATYDDYIDVEGQSFPTNVRFIDEVNDADTSVRVKSISLNPEVPEGAFQQAPSPGMSIELASCS